MRRASIARSAKFFVRRARVSKLDFGARFLEPLLKDRPPRSGFQEISSQESVLRSALQLGTHRDIGFQHFGNWATAFGTVCGLLEGCSICVGDSSNHVEVYGRNCPSRVLFFHGESG